jgi:hypothetical protein
LDLASVAPRLPSGGQNFTAEQNGFSWVGVLKDPNRDHVGYQVPGRRHLHCYFRGLKAQPAECEPKHKLKDSLECRGHGPRIENAVAVLAVGLLRQAEVVFDRHESRAAHDSYSAARRIGRNSRSRDSRYASCDTVNGCN